MFLLTTKRVVLCSLFSCMMTPLFAAAPILDITALTPTTCFLPSNGACLVEYQVTNNRHGLVSRPTPSKKPGLIDLSSSNSASGNNCHNIDNLSPGGSCVISLLFSAEDLPSGGITSGPSIPTSVPPSSSNPFWHSQPIPSEQLHITSTGVPAAETLTASNLALSVNNTALNAALTGNSRNITISNNGTKTAYNVTYVISPALPTGTSISPASCGDIAANGTCTLTVTPGATAANTPLTLYAFGTNTSLLSIQLDILTYGSVYQSGYVFAMDDTTPDTSSVGGKVVTLEGQALPWPLGIVWLSNGQVCEATSLNQNCTDYTSISGTDETSTSSPTTCNGNSDGTCNTSLIVAYANNTTANIYAPVSSTEYAAGLCTATIGGFSDWYLPAICEMGYYLPAPNTPTINSGCGASSSPLQQNILQNLHEANLGHFLGVYRTSTQFSGENGTAAWDQYLLFPGLQATNVQTHDQKSDPTGVRCVRAITQP